MSFVRSLTASFMFFLRRALKTRRLRDARCAFLPDFVRSAITAGYYKKMAEIATFSLRLLSVLTYTDPMIGHLKGTVIALRESTLILDIQGVGYKVAVLKELIAR